MTKPEEATVPTAVGTPLEPTVGRLPDEATNACGPSGTYGCACLDSDSVQCAAIRYGMDHWGEACQCLCHQWGDDDDDLG